MGEWLAGVRAHRRVIALGAVVLLPLSTAAATETVAAPSEVPIGLLASSSTAAGVSMGYPTAARELDASKALPAGWTEASGHTVVVVGTTRQRVAQVSATSSHDIPLAALSAYKHAELSVAASSPGCHLSWTLLAAIGQVESDNGRYGGAVVLANGDTSPHILGPVLNGTGDVGAIRDTDGGAYDGDAVWDRAVGPMQFIPGTWAGYGADGNGDGVRDPNNIADAALAAANYLCAGGGDLRVESQLRAAVMRYNYSVAYVDLVISLARAYASGAATVVPNGHAALPPGGQGSDHQAKALPVRHQPGEQRAHRVKGSGHHGSGGQGSGTGGGGGGTGGGRGGGGTGGGRGGGGTGGGGGGGTGGQPPTTGTPSKPPTTTAPAPPTTSVPVATGILSSCKTGWCVGETALDFGATADLTARQGDYNADGRIWSMARELRSLEGQTISVLLVRPVEPTTPDRAAVSGIPTNPTAPAVPAAPTDPAAPVAPVVPVLPPTTPTTPVGTTPPTTDPAVVITIDADGIVTSVNGVAYTAPDATP